MQQILIVNAKGGSGKSTLATNLAGYYACWGGRVALVDFDPQHSALDWLRNRPGHCPAIKGVNGVSGKRLPPQIDYLIADLPPGMNTDLLAKLLPNTDAILVPVLPSQMDMRASWRFIFTLLQHHDLNLERTRIGLVANRVKENTRSYQRLRSFLQGMQLTYVGNLRETQNYAVTADKGVSIFDMPQRKVFRDLMQWQQIVCWLDEDSSSLLMPAKQKITFC